MFVPDGTAAWKAGSSTGSPSGDLCERQKTNSQRYRLFILRLLPAAMAFRTPQVMCRAFQAQFEAVRIIMNFGFSSVSLDLM
jgi:hypothetical protein